MVLINIGIRFATPEIENDYGCSLLLFLKIGSEVEEKYFFYIMSEDEAQHSLYTFWVILGQKMVGFICPSFLSRLFFFWVIGPF